MQGTMKTESVFSCGVKRNLSPEGALGNLHFHFVMETKVVDLVVVDSNRILRLNKLVTLLFLIHAIFRTTFR